MVSKVEQRPSWKRIMIKLSPNEINNDASLKPQNHPHLKDLAICNISSDGNSINALIISDLSSSCSCPTTA